MTGTRVSFVSVPNHP